VRFNNDQVLAETEAVLEVIAAALSLSERTGR
jgi:very-short-patch-repair endonuclease